MNETPFLGPHSANGRALIALFVVLVVLPAFAALFSGWSLFSFPLATFLVGVIVPVGLIIVAFMVPSHGEDETAES